MAASIALPPSRSTCAPASLASRCGLAITPRVRTSSGYRAGRQEFDRSRLDLEQRRHHAGVLAIDVDPHFFRRRDLDALAVKDGDLRVVIVEMLALADLAQAAQGLDL